MVESKMEREREKEWRERDKLREVICAEDFQSMLFWPSAGTDWPLIGAAVRLWGRMSESVQQLDYLDVLS